MVMEQNNIIRFHLKTRVLTVLTALKVLLEDSEAEDDLKLAGEELLDDGEPPKPL